MELDTIKALVAGPLGPIWTAMETASALDRRTIACLHLEHWNKTYPKAPPGLWDRDFETVVRPWMAETEQAKAMWAFRLHASLGMFEYNKRIKRA